MIQPLHCVIRWLGFVEPHLTTGHRALLRVHLMPQLRLLDKQCCKMISMHFSECCKIQHLVARCIYHGTPAFNNKQIGLDPKHVEVVEFMLRFKRSYICRARVGNDAETVEYDRFGSIAWVSTGMVDYLHNRFQQEVQVAKGAMLSRTSMLHARIPWMRRSSSVPRVHDPSRMQKPHRRSKSLPRADCGCQGCRL